jgi:phage head maturation protease
VFCYYIHDHGFREIRFSMERVKALDLHDTAEVMGAMRWCWLSQWVDTLQGIERDTQLSPYTTFAGTHGLSPSGRFSVYVCPKISGIHSASHLEIHDLYASKESQASSD